MSLRDDARLLVLNRHRQSQMLGKLTATSSDAEHARLNAVDDEVERLRAIVKPAIEALTGVTWDELEEAL
jgi:hypothetical protein